MKRLSQQQVESFFIENGCLLKDKYINAKTKMNYICKCGKPASCNYDNFKKQKGCYDCGLKKLADTNRLDYNYVKEYFEEQNCTLLSKTYIDSKHKLQYICSCGTKSSIRFQNFKLGKRCGRCNGTRKVKYTIEEVREIVSRSNFLLLSTDYENVHADLELLCSNGHNYNAPLRSILSGVKCKICTGREEISIKEVAEIFNLEGCTLLETDYTNTKAKLNYICSCGNRASGTFSSFKKGVRCKQCQFNNRSLARLSKISEIESYVNNYGYKLLSRSYSFQNQPVELECPVGHQFKIGLYYFKNGTRCPSCQNINVYDLEMAREIFSNQGCTLLADKYINSVTSMDYICECSNQSKITLSSFQRGRRCKACSRKKISKKKMKNIDDIIQFFTLNNCKLLTTDYTGKDQKLSYICHCGKETSATWNNFRKGHIDCEECSLKKVSGQNSWRYNFDLSDEERLLKRSYSDYSIWLKEVYNRDNFTCQCCGNIGAKLNAHHLDSYDWCKSLRVDIDNGITLCELCHKDFHGVFGYGLNTREQFEEYMEGVSWNCSGIYIGFSKLIKT